MKFHIISAAVDLRIHKMDAQRLLLDEYANQQLRTKIYPLTLDCLYPLATTCIDRILDWMYPVFWIIACPNVFLIFPMQ